MDDNCCQYESEETEVVLYERREPEFAGGKKVVYGYGFPLKYKLWVQEKWKSRSEIFIYFFYSEQNDLPAFNGCQ